MVRYLEMISNDDFANYNMLKCIKFTDSYDKKPR